MAKFCNSCGSQNDDQAIACATCGKPFEAPAAQQPVSPTIAQPVQNGIPGVPGTSNSKKFDLGMIKKFAPIIGAALVAIIVLVVILSSAGGVKGKAKKVGKAIKADDAEKIASLIDEDAFSRVKEATNSEDDDDDEDLEESYEEILKYINDYFEEKLDDDDYKLSYEIGDIDECDAEDVIDSLSMGYSSEDTIDNFVEEFEDDKFKSVELKITAKSDDDEEETTVTLYFLKDGGWKLIYVWPDEEILLSAILSQFAG